MSDNVFHFSTRRRLDPEEQAALNQKRDQAKLDWINGGGSKRGPILGRLRDRMNAAQANGRLIAEVKSSGITVHQIMQKFGSAEDPRRIDRYSLPAKHDLASADVRRRAGTRLMKKVRGYLSLAETLAGLLGRDPDLTKIEVLKNTGFWTDLDSQENPDIDIENDDDRAYQLTTELNSMAQSVVSRANLPAIYSRERRIPDQPEGNGQFHETLFYPNFQNIELGGDETPPLPAVPIARFFHAEFETRVVVSASVNSAPGSVSQQPLSRVFGKEIGACFNLYREIQLCLGPTTGEDEIGAMFNSISRLNIRLDVDGETIDGMFCPHPNHSSIELWPFVAGVEDQESFIRVADEEYQIRITQPVFSHEEIEESFEAISAGKLATHPFWWKAFPLWNNDDCLVEIDSLSWMPVNTEYVSYWLDRDIDDPTVISIVPAPETGSEPMPKATWFDGHKLAYAVELALSTGAIEEKLYEEINRIGKNIDQRENEWRIAAGQKSAENLARWSKESDDQS
jgi:hypothetical protein